MFQPYFVQAGRGPHLGDYTSASGINGDPFRCNFAVTSDGIKISDSAGRQKIGIDVRWNVEGSGYLDYTTDNAGEFYQLPPSGKSTTPNLNYELARSRVASNRKREALFSAEGWKTSHESRALLSLAEEYRADAEKLPPPE